MPHVKAYWVDPRGGHAPEGLSSRLPAPIGGLIVYIYWVSYKVDQVYILFYNIRPTAHLTKILARDTLAGGGSTNVVENSTKLVEHPNFAYASIRFVTVIETFVELRAENESLINTPELE